MTLIGQLGRKVEQQMAVKTIPPPCWLGARAQLEGRMPLGHLWCQGGGSPWGAGAEGFSRKGWSCCRVWSVLEAPGVLRAQRFW